MACEVASEARGGLGTAGRCDHCRANLAKGSSTSCGRSWSRKTCSGTCRLDDLAGHLRIVRHVLADRLARRTGRGLARRIPDREPGREARHQYRLAGMHRDLSAAMQRSPDGVTGTCPGAAGPVVPAAPGQVHRIDGELTWDQGQLLAQSDRVLSHPSPGTRPGTTPSGPLQLPSRAVVITRKSRRAHGVTGGTDLDDRAR